MNQSAHQAIAMMLNAFPQGGQDYRLLLLTYEEDLAGISDQAICETAQRFRRNDIPDQSATFAPSVAEFVTAARRQEEFISIRNRPRIRGPVVRPLPPSPPIQRRTEEERQRQRERMAKFHGTDDQEAELAAIRAKYDPDELAKIPDAPLPHGVVQVASALKKFVA